MDRRWNTCLRTRIWNGSTLFWVMLKGVGDSGINLVELEVLALLLLDEVLQEWPLLLQLSLQPQKALDLPGLFVELHDVLGSGVVDFEVGCGFLDGEPLALNQIHQFLPFLNVNDLIWSFRFAMRVLCVLRLVLTLEYVFLYLFSLILIYWPWAQVLLYHLRIKL